MAVGTLSHSNDNHNGAKQRPDGGQDALGISEGN